MSWQTSKEVFDIWIECRRYCEQSKRNPEIGTERKTWQKAILSALIKARREQKLCYSIRRVCCSKETIFRIGRSLMKKDGCPMIRKKLPRNAVQVVKNLVKDSGISKGCVKGIGISNQRETSLIWEKETGKALANAVVWQCARAADICRRVEQTGAAEKIRTKTGLALSPYFPASKLAWLKENVEISKVGEKHELCFGTIDTWLVYKMTHGVSYKTDYSNASRTQLFDIFEKTWDELSVIWIGCTGSCRGV